MKANCQTMNLSAPLLGAFFLLTSIFCLVVSAKQPQPEALTPSFAPAGPDLGVIQVGCDDCRCGKNCGGRCCSECCEAVCCPKRVEKEVKKHCWKVEPKLVCIPGFRWPWERCDHKNPGCADGCDCAECCALPCGRVRCVNVLEKHEYKCQECGYEWEAKCIRSSSQKGSCCGRSCPSCGSDCNCDS
ncbi:MAG: hypothetical protein KDA57_20770 [Planctomycetales bacterium]|nr:hypothetical protein [Planctomycetales bacterium]